MTIEPCPPETVQRVIEEIFDVPLLKSRFEKVKPLQYVRSRLNQMHDVIKFKGEHVSLLFTWGLSLRFVPHITMGVGDIRWHRTAKSASMDLIYSGFHHDCNHRGFRIRTIQGKDALRDDAITTRDHLLPKALHSFNTKSFTTNGARSSPTCRKLPSPIRFTSQRAARNKKHGATCPIGSNGTTNGKRPSNG